MRDLFVLVAATALVACSSPSNGGSESGGSGAGAATAGAAGNSAVGGNAGAGAGAGGTSASGASTGGASSGGVGGTLTSGGTGNGGAAGAAVSAGTGGSSGSAQGGSSGGVAGGVASAGSAGSADDTVDSCLPVGQEKLVMKITGTPALDITTPTDLKCLSQYLPPDENGKTQFNLVWDTADGTLNVAVRGDDLAPLKAGAFEPFAVLIGNEDKAWLGLANKCHVTITASEKIADEHPPGFTREVYKVTGSMACDSGWALGKPTDTLDQFQFVTRVTRAVSP